MAGDEIFNLSPLTIPWAPTHTPVKGGHTHKTHWMRAVTNLRAVCHSFKEHQRPSAAEREAAQPTFQLGKCLLLPKVA